MEIKIIFLGTSQAVPTKKRNHTSILLNYNEENVLIDCGEGTQRQFRKAKINPCKLTRILITHWHGDHILGLPGLFQTLALNNYSKTLYVYGPKGTKKYIEQITKLFIPINKIKIKVEEVNGKFLETKNFEFSSAPMQHSTPCNAYIFQEKDKLKIDKNKLSKIKIPFNERVKLKFLTQKKNIIINNKKINYKTITYNETGKKISFVLDTKINPVIDKIIKNSDLVILESTYSDKEKKLAEEYKHMTAKQDAELCKKNKVKQLILTHTSQRYENNEGLLLKEAKKIFPNTKLAEDFMEITLK